MNRDQGSRWCFTLNNYTAEEKQRLLDLIRSDETTYGVLGYEIGQGGTPHIQGFVVLRQRRRFGAAKALCGARCHLELARGTSWQAAQYCKKDGDYDEEGVLHPQQGRRSDWEQLRDYLRAAQERPSIQVLWDLFPNLVGRYRSSVIRAVDELFESPPREIGQPRAWQRQLELELDGEPDDRSIRFVIDSVGNSGKTWFIRYYMCKNPNNTQMMSIGKRDDMAHTLCVDIRCLFINVPRGCMEYLQYSFLESVKDKMVFSPKYESATKFLDHNVHVIVMCNELPDYTRLSRDRFIELLLTNNNNE